MNIYFKKTLFFENAASVRRVIILTPSNICQQRRCCCKFYDGLSWKLVNPLQSAERAANLSKPTPMAEIRVPACQRGLGVLRMRAGTSHGRGNGAWSKGGWAGRGRARPSETLHKALARVQDVESPPPPSRAPLSN